MSSFNTDEIKNLFDACIKQAKSLPDLEEIRVKFLGKKGLITELISKISSLSSEEKKTYGSLIHQLRSSIEQKLTSSISVLKVAIENTLLSKEKIDVTLSIANTFPSALHPISKTIKRIYDIFSKMGYKTVFGPEIESEYYNFDALNIPKNHPARNLADTFFLNKENTILRTQTSGVQIREMEKNSTPPISMISPGLCFRKDEIDATHLPFFHQIEGLAIDKNISFSDLKGVLSLFAKEFFGTKTQIRFRPDFFPFVEPGAEVAFSCPVCMQKNPQCPTCRGTGYIEVAGCGLIHPQVLKNGNIDPEVYSGYAFGFGVERLTMIYYGIKDIRFLYENHPDFLAQFQAPIF